MEWRNELITSAAEGEALLRAYLRPMRVFPLGITSHQKSGLFFSAESGLEGVVGVKAVITNGFCNLTNLDVGEQFRGKKLALIAVKAVLGLAHERSVQIVKIFNASDDGPSFWPTLGAMPEEEPRQIGRFIRQVLGQRRKELSPSNIEMLESIAKLGGRDPWVAWRRLSQTDIRLVNGKQFKASVFNSLCAHCDLLIDLQNPETRAILEKRLGVIPSFRPSVESIHKVSRRAQPSFAA